MPKRVTIIIAPNTKNHRSKREALASKNNQYPSLFSLDNISLQNLHLLKRLIRIPGLDQSHPLDHLQPALDAAEDCVLPIQPWRWRQRDEELAPVRVRPTVGHAEDPRARVLQSRVDLVLELLPVDGAPAASRARGVARLDHEVGDDPVEDHVVVVAFAGEAFKVLAGLRDLSLC